MLGDNRALMPASETDSETASGEPQLDPGQASITSGLQETRLPVVLQVLPALEGGGVERGTVDVAIALAQAGWGAVVASEGGAMVRELARAGVTHVELPLASKNPFVMRANIERIQRVIEDYGVDIVHARSRAPAWSAEAAAKRTGAHFVTTFHGTYNDRPFPKRYYNAVMARGERVIAISEFIARHAIERYKVDPARIRIIHRGVDVNLFDPDNVTQQRIIQLAGRWHLPDDRKIILLPGRVSNWKGHDLMIEALARLGRRDVLCVMAGADNGDSAFMERLAALARSRDVGDLVRFTEFYRDMPAAYMLSDVVVSCAVKPEAFGRTLAEAGAMGRPVVGPAHGGALEIVDEGITGWLYKPGNSESLATALHAALALKAEARYRLAAEAMRRVRANFVIDRMCAETLAVYAEVLEEANLAAAS